MKHQYRCIECRSQVRLVALAQVILHWCYICRKTTAHRREQ